MYEAPERRVWWWIVGGMKGVGSEGVVVFSLASMAGGVCDSSAILGDVCGYVVESGIEDRSGSEKHRWETRFSRDETRRDTAKY